jgi:hypothetical protein
MGKNMLLPQGVIFFNPTVIHNSNDFIHMFADGQDFFTLRLRRVPAGAVFSLCAADA